MPVCREFDVPLWGLWGGADVRAQRNRYHHPGSQQSSARLSWRAVGTRKASTLKTKVGVDVDTDILRVRAVHDAFPDIAYVIDANQGFAEAQCRMFMKALAKCNATIVLLEQPVPREDLEGMAALRRDLKIPIAADESVRSLQDVKDIAGKHVRDFINIKITKCGLLNAVEMATFFRSMGSLNGRRNGGDTPCNGVFLCHGPWTGRI